ncbi:MAG: aldose 1-epimerase [Clostridia bacterium]|nr:aldose 1-epimerase [Clostridia bacterium]
MKFLKIQNEKYEAEFLSEYGGNCVRLFHKPTGTELLRSPADLCVMQETPLLYGTPLLVPPNRISGGKFVFKGREYVLPLNEPEHNNHCHGELYRSTAEVATQKEDEIVFRFFSDKTYLGFPHKVELLVRFKLDDEGMSKDVTVRNLGKESMPFAVAFHTTFNLVFNGGEPNEYVLKMPVMREFLREMTHYIPTGETDENFEEKKALNEGTYKPAEHFITKFTELQGESAEIIHLPTGRKIVYWADPLYKFRHIFNGGSKEFICVEPQTCRIDALNVWGDIPESGVLEIAGGSALTLKSKICLKG